ncbi:hypothetical protein [Actinoplanes sp. NPDC089786]|uniref:hypothetical protein n=1 Tax=Actinoplanes sp. NPDC089786 TaxID=3155185 RepID=UPI003441598E
MSGGPASALGVTAEVLPPDRVRLLFAPWAALNAARADVYRVRKEEDGRLWAEEKLEASGYCAIRRLIARLVLAVAAAGAATLSLAAPASAASSSSADYYGSTEDCVVVKHDVGWVNQTVYFQNNCGRTITFRVFRAGASLPCVAVEPGEQGGWRWNRAAWVTGYELDCELEE